MSQTTVDKESLDFKIDQLETLVFDRTHTDFTVMDSIIGTGAAITAHMYLLPAIGGQRLTDSPIGYITTGLLAIAATKLVGTIRDYARSSCDPVIADAKQELTKLYEKRE